MSARRLLFAVLSLFIASSLTADTFTLAGAGGNWTNLATWLQNGLTAARAPGTMSGTTDVVNLNASNYTVTVDVIVAEPVELHTTCPGAASTCVVDVPPAGTLALTNLSASSIGTDAHVQLSGGVIDAAGALDFNIGSHLDWTGGTLTGAGVTSIAFDSVMPAEVTLSGAGSKTLDAHEIQIQGKGQFASGPFSIDNGGVLNITSSGTFDVATSDPIQTNNAATSGILNAGMFQKSAGSGFTDIQTKFQNDGFVETLSESLNFHADGTHTGTFTSCTGCFIEFASGSDTLDGATFDGTGTFKIAGASFTVTTNGAQVTSDFFFGAGSLTGSGSLVIDGGFQWSGGSMSGTGDTTLDAGPDALFDAQFAPIALNGRTFTNNRLILYAPSGANRLSIDNGAHFINQGTFNIDGDFDINSGGPAAAVFENADDATLAKTGGASTAHIACRVDNEPDGFIIIVRGPRTNAVALGGLIDVTTGVLDLLGGGSSQSAINLAAGTEIDFSGGVFDISGGATLTGSGTMRISGATVNVDAPLTAPRFLLDSGSLSGSAMFTVDDGVWMGGDMDGSGLTLIPSTKTFEIATGITKRLRRPLQNDGTLVTINLPAAVTLENGSVLTNNGLMELQQNTNFFCTCSPTPSLVHNSGSGTIHQFNAAGTSNFLTQFNNDGTVVLDTGLLILLNDGVHAGDFAVGSASALRFGGASQSFSATSDISGDGAVQFDATNSTLAGTLVLTGGGMVQTLSGATALNTTSAASMPTLILDADIAGSAAIDITGGTASVWDGGTISGTGAFTIGAGAQLYIDGNVGPMTLDGRTMTNAGEIDIRTDNPINVGAPATIANNGTFQKSTGSGTTNIGPAVTNSDFVNLLVGTTAFDGGFTQSAGTTRLDGGNLASPLQIDVNGGTLEGSGTITGSLSSAGSISPGLSPGLLTIDGDYTQSAGGSLDVELGGTAPGSGYDRLAVTGTATLAGPLNVTLINPFVPGGGDIFDVLTFAARSGDFSAKNLPAYSGGSLSASYQPTALRLTASGAPGLTADIAVLKSGPSNAAAGSTIVYTITVTNHGPDPAASVLVSDPTPPNLTFVSNSGDCTTPFPCSLGTLLSGASKTITATYAIAAQTEGSTISNTASASSTTSDPAVTNNQDGATTHINCTNTTPTSLSPQNGATVPATGTLSWSGTGDQFVVFLGPVGSGCSTQFDITNDHSLPYALAAGKAYEWRVESLQGICPVRASACTPFVTESGDCPLPARPNARVVGQATSGKSYTVEWDAVPDAVRYEIDEATSADFSDAVTTVVDGLSYTFSHAVAEPTAFFYRVRAFRDCRPDPGLDSIPVRVVIVPLEVNAPGPNVNIPAGSTEVVIQDVFIPGQSGATLFFTATTDRPWLTVNPSEGVLPPDGVTLHVSADPSTLPNGTFTASLIVAISETASSRGAVANGTTTVTLPIPINIVTPISPVASKDATSQYAMVIPSVGHLDGIDSHWRSDVRLTNAGFRSYRYRLTFTPSGGTAQGVKQTDVTVDAGATIALDDIVRNWYGIGALGDAANGMLEILPLDEPETSSLVTLASSRTYNATGDGTLGQFIPAIRVSDFIGTPPAGTLPKILSLQQIAQSSAFRTNVGVAEGLGSATNVVLHVFDSAGTKLLDLPLTLAAGEQRQINGVLAQNGISLPDGRIEVEVTSGDGKVTAYASVVDNQTNDPLLVSGMPLDQGGEDHYVLPGAANIDNPVAHWRTDMRVFNYADAAQPVTLTFYPFAGSETKTAALTIDPGQVLTLDNVVSSLFGSVNTGGVVHLDTPAASKLIVSARTYNQTDAGTYGQFIPAVTPGGATEAGGKTLNILQVEDSTRYRTNIGLTEVSGNPALVELQVNLPDSKITPTVHISLAANEFRQFALLRELGLGNVYNARVSVRVLSGDGRIAAYGSVIDETTQDPTYVPAQ